MRLCAVTDRLPARLDLTGIEPVNMSYFGETVPAVITNENIAAAFKSDRRFRIAMLDREPALHTHPDRRDWFAMAGASMELMLPKCERWVYSPIDQPSQDWPDLARASPTAEWLLSAIHAGPAVSNFTHIGFGAYWIEGMSEAELAQHFIQCDTVNRVASACTRTHPKRFACVSPRYRGQGELLTLKQFDLTCGACENIGIETLCFFSDEPSFNPKGDHARTLKPYLETFRGFA